MKGECGRKPIGEVCQIVNGGTPKTGISKYWGGNHLWITPAEMGKRATPYVEETQRKITDLGLRDSSARMLPPYSVILSSRAPIGHLVINTVPMATNQGCKGLVPSRELEYKFLYYYLSSSVDLLNSLGTGTTFKELSGAKLKEITIPLPPLSEQRRIVDILDEAIAAIAVAKGNTERNLTNTRALLEHHLQSVFTRSSQGWPMVRMGEVTELARGQNPPKSKFSRLAKPGYVRFYQIRDGATDDYAVYVPDTPQLHKMAKSDIMMVAYRHVGRVFRGVEGAFNVALCKISNANIDLVDDDYLFHIIPSRFVKGELLKRSERSLIPSMSIEHLRELRIPLPPLQVQQQIVEQINGLYAQTQQLESIYQRKLGALEALKKSLLHQAFTGQLTAQSVEAHSPSVSHRPSAANITSTDLHAGILAMAFLQHEKHGKLSVFTHVKAEKIAHMIEARLGLDLGRSPVKDAAGPNDFPHLIRVEHRARMANYFNFKRDEQNAYRVQKLRGFNALVDKTHTALGEENRKAVERLIQWMLPMAVQQAEIVATVFASWNNLLLAGEGPTDEQIVFESRENWHSDKLKIDRERFFKAVKWLRDQGVVPEGKGKRVVAKGK